MVKEAVARLGAATSTRIAH